MQKLLCAFVFSMAVFASEASVPLSRPATGEVKAAESGARLWKASIASLAIVHAVDTQSSWGKCEGNSFLASGSGQFGARGMAFKSAFVGGLAMAEYLTGRRHPKLYGLFTAGNFGVSAGLGGMAGHNYTVAAPGVGYGCGPVSH